MASAAVAPRHLVLQNVRKNALKVAATPAASSDPPLAQPGDMKLYSFYKPSLVAGTYDISVSQKVQVPAGNPPSTYPASDNDLTTTADYPHTQPFEVVGPQFNIDPKDVHSVYPPQGHADQPSILPHIVFNDEHLPWERKTSTSSHEDDDIVPWMAVFPFDCNRPADNRPTDPPELMLSSSQLNGAGAVYTRADNSTVVQSSTFSISMTLQDYLQLDSHNGFAGATKVHIPPYPKEGLDSTTPVEVIFLNAVLFNNLFPQKPDGTGTDIGRYQYAAHCRNINTVGMASAGVEDSGIFSILHSLRTGPTDIAQSSPPRSQTVHLVSIEFVDQLLAPSSGDFVALISLYSWTYLCQPPLSVNFVDSMRTIGTQIKTSSCLLRVPDATLKGIANVAGLSEQKSAIAQRFSLGYSLVRHRSPSGELTVAFNRSPLAPTTLQAAAQNASWPWTSNNGQEYQIFDKQLGILDITYSTAWQLGKTLASADLGFVGALMRIRSRAHSAGVTAANTSVMQQHINIPSKGIFLNGLHRTARSLKSVASITKTTSPSAKARWAQAGASVPPDVADPGLWKRNFAQAVSKNIQESAAVKSADPHPDWTLIYNWIMDKLFLDSLPMHYLITDPAHLPPESIRFFHVDNIWMDCLIDGALSVANHLARDDDLIRQEIKASINSLLDPYNGQQYGPEDTDHPPQIPVYGFFLRSAVVSIFPDLRVTAPYPSEPSSVRSHGRLDVLSHRLVNKDTMLVLLDRLPDNGTIDHIRLSQPPHQQRFSAGDNLNENSIEFVFRKVFKEANLEMMHELGEPHTFLKTSKIYDWASRCLQMDVFENELFFGPGGLYHTLPEGKWSQDSKLDSSMTALQLTDSMKYLELITASQTITDGVGIIPIRKIYLGATPPPPLLLTEDSDILSAIDASSNASATQPTKPSAVVNEVKIVAPLAPPAPHVTAPRSLDNSPKHLNTIASKSIAKEVGPQGSGGQALFDYSIYQSTVPYSTSLRGKGLITVSTPYSPDIIFSVKLRPGVNIADDRLHDVTFRIPISDSNARRSPTDISGGIGLVPAADPDGEASPGTMPRMLSNQRWIVHMDHQPAYLVLRLIPRSMKEYDSVSRSPLGLSFKLNEVDVTGPTGKYTAKGNVIMMVTETWGHFTDPPANSNFVLTYTGMAKVYIQRQ